MLEHISSQTRHARRGSVHNSFGYSIDYVLSDFSDDGPTVFSRNRFNLWSLWDHKHGGARGDGRGVVWFRDVLDARGFDTDSAQLLLLTQPSYLGLHFNPVSFWIAVIDGQPRAFVAEVNNTFGHRHCYFCAHADFSAITPATPIIAEKMMHVSPFQQVAGDYTFQFGMTDQAFNIRISYENGDQGVVATLSGKRKPATNQSLLWAAVRRPFGSGRVVALIMWQALKLKFKRAPFKNTPPPPDPLLTDSATFKGQQP